MEESISINERKALGNRFRIVSYSDVAAWIDECASKLTNNGSRRIAFILEEISDYIQRAFMKRNPIKERLMGNFIEENILDAFEIQKMWTKHKKDYETAWQDRINLLINIELPQLVFSKLIKMGAISVDEWEFVQGKFDIRKEHLEGPKIRKVKWNSSSIGVISDRFRVEKGTRNFFPAVISSKKIDRPGYIEEYCKATGSPIALNPFLKMPPTVWYANFPDPEYQNWGYKQWKEIHSGGETVQYVAEYLGKLISACEKDIDEIES